MVVWVCPSLPRLVIRLRGTLENVWILIGSQRTLVQWTDESSLNRSVLAEGWQTRKPKSIEVMTFGMEQTLTGAEILVKASDWNIVRVDQSCWRVHPVLFDDE